MNLATRNTACTKYKSLPLALSLVSEALFFLQLWQYFVSGIQRFVMKIADVLLCGNSQRSETQLLLKAAFCAWWSQSGAQNCCFLARCLDHFWMSQAKCVGRSTKETWWQLESCKCTLLKNVKYSKQGVSMIADSSNATNVPYWCCVSEYYCIITFPLLKGIE